MKSKTAAFLTVIGGLLVVNLLFWRMVAHHYGQIQAKPESSAPAVEAPADATWAESLVYAKDKFGICYAKHQYTMMYGRHGSSITTVPCDKVGL